MARIDSLTNFLTDVATAIKNKKGDNTSIKASDFDTEITNLPSGSGITVEKGFIAEEYDIDGYVTKARVVGMTELPMGAFTNYNSTVGSFLGKNLKEVVLPNETTILGERAFNWCSNLTTINFGNITDIGINCFNNCKGLPSKLILNGVKNIGKSAFYNTPIEQISLPNIEKIYDTDANSPFGFCANLYKIWIGSGITDLGRYALRTRGSTADTQHLRKVYIDLPRATVEAFSGYTTYRFVDTNNPNYQPTIICNDDENFITKEEFDAIEF